MKIRMPDRRSNPATIKAFGPKTSWNTPRPTAMNAPTFCNPAHRKTGSMTCRERRTCSNSPPNRNMNMPMVPKHCFVAGVTSAEMSPRMKLGAKICTMPETTVEIDMRTSNQCNNQNSVLWRFIRERPQFSCRMYERSAPHKFRSVIGNGNRRRQPLLALGQVDDGFHAFGWGCGQRSLAQEPGFGMIVEYAVGLRQESGQDRIGADVEILERLHTRMVADD